MYTGPASTNVLPAASSAARVHSMLLMSGVLLGFGCVEARRRGRSASGRGAPVFALEKKYVRVYLLAMARPSLREKIIESGVRTLHERGFAGAGVREITADAGVPQGCFTNHFRSKEAFAA